MSFKNLLPYPKKEKYRSINARKVNTAKFPNSYLYILQIENTTHYKIGVSQKPKRRIHDIRSAIPYRVNVIYMKKYKNTYELEEVIHDNYQDKEMNHEWFDLSDNDLQGVFEFLNHMTKEGYYIIRRELQVKLEL